MSDAADVVIRKLSPNDEIALSELFETLLADASASRFRPHPMEHATARALANYAKKDLYFGVWAGDELAGYAMLRGFDAGYVIPSLGIYVAPQFRGRGMAQTCLAHLHDVAKEVGASRVMLRVFPDNGPAVHIYEKLGYTFDGKTDDRGEKIGYLTLQP